MSEMFGSTQNVQQFPMKDPTTQPTTNNSANLPQINVNNPAVPIMQKGAINNIETTTTQRPQSNMFKLQKQRSEFVVIRLLETPLNLINIFLFCCCVVLIYVLNRLQI